MSGAPPATRPLVETIRIYGHTYGIRNTAYGIHTGSQTRQTRQSKGNQGNLGQLRPINAQSGQSDERVTQSLSHSVRPCLSVTFFIFQGSSLMGKRTGQERAGKWGSRSTCAEFIAGSFLSVFNPPSPHPHPPPISPLPHALFSVISVVRYGPFFPAFVREAGIVPAHTVINPCPDEV